MVLHVDCKFVGVKAPRTESGSEARPVDEEGSGSLKSRVSCVKGQKRNQKKK